MDKISDNLLNRCFLKNPKQTIYVTETVNIQKRKLFGLIILGSFSQYKLKSLSLLNIAYAKVYDKEKTISLLTEINIFLGLLQYKN